MNQKKKRLATTYHIKQTSKQASKQTNEQQISTQAWP